MTALPVTVVIVASIRVTVTEREGPNALGFPHPVAPRARRGRASHADPHSGSRLYPGPGSGGSGRYVQETSRLFVDARHEVSVLTGRRDDCPDHEIFDGVDVFRYDLESRTAQRHAGRRDGPRGNGRDTLQPAGRPRRSGHCPRSLRRRGRSRRSDGRVGSTPCRRALVCRACPSAVHRRELHPEADCDSPRGGVGHRRRPATGSPLPPNEVAPPADRCRGQAANASPTLMRWTSQRIVEPCLRPPRRACW